MLQPWLTEGCSSEIVSRLRDDSETAGPEDARLIRASGGPASLPQGERTLFIISGRCGRLANRLVLFANFIALAEEHGYRVMNPTFHSYASFFETTRRDIYCQYPAARRRSLLDVMPGVAQAIRGTRLFFRLARPLSLLNERFPIFGSGMVTLRQSPGHEITALDGKEVQSRIRHARIVLVNGWNFRAPALVRIHAEKIREYFRPIAELEQASAQAVARLRGRADLVVGVHIRRGDYRTLGGAKWFFPVSRYAQWMRELAEQFLTSKISFLVCSDEPRSLEEFPGLSVECRAGSPMADLYGLAKCDYIFGPVSTFSQWASFYGSKPLFHLKDANARLERENFKVSDLHEIP